MKTTTTQLFIGLTTLLFSSQIVAQTSHEVTVSSNQFTPSELTIDVGDTVVWTNVQGNHNVNGTVQSYPENPESFGNSVGSGWTYSFVFTLPGTYAYHCDPHELLGMVGEITVEDVTTSISEANAENGLVSSVFPVPATDVVWIELDAQKMTAYPEAEWVLYDQLGRLQKSQSAGQVDRIEVDVRDLHSGLYVFQLVNAGEVLHTSRLIVR